MAPAAPRFGERPTVAGVVRRRLLTAGRIAIGRTPTAQHHDAGILACGHPAHQAHARFHPFALGAGRLARG